MKITESQLRNMITNIIKENLSELSSIDYQNQMIENYRQQKELVFEPAKKILENYGFKVWEDNTNMYIINISFPNSKNAALQLSQACDYLTNYFGETCSPDFNNSGSGARIYLPAFTHIKQK